MGLMANLFFYLSLPGLSVDNLIVLQTLLVWKFSLFVGMLNHELHNIFSFGRGQKNKITLTLFLFERVLIFDNIINFYYI